MIELNYAQILVVMAFFFGLLAGAAGLQLCRTLLGAARHTDRTPARRAPEGERTHFDNQTTANRATQPESRGAGDAHA